MRDVMIDLETFGTGPNATVVQIGAVYFDRETGLLGESFKVNVSAESAQKSGADIDANTVRWWLAQSQEARNSLLDGGDEDIRVTFIALNQFLIAADTVWSHATFDFVIIMQTFRRLGLKPNISFRSARDIRTLMDLAEHKTSDFRRDGVHHNALDDAKFQVKYCVEALKKLKKN